MSGEVNIFLGTQAATEDWSILDKMTCLPRCTWMFQKLSVNVIRFKKTKGSKYGKARFERIIKPSKVDVCLIQLLNLIRNL